LLSKLVGNVKNCEWIYRFSANPGKPRGGVLPPFPVLAPESALGSRPRVALSSAQAHSEYLRSHPVCKSHCRRSASFALPSLASGFGLRQLSLPLGPDLFPATRQLVRRRQVADGAMQPHCVVQQRGRRPTVPSPVRCITLGIPGSVARCWSSKRSSGAIGLCLVASSRRTSRGGRSNCHGGCSIGLPVLRCAPRSRLSWDATSCGG